MKKLSFAAFWVAFFLTVQVRAAEEIKPLFMERPVQLTIQSAGGTPQVRNMNVMQVKEVITKLNGEAKRTQVYLIQRFLADAKANVEMTIKVDGDIYQLNNDVHSEGNKPLQWGVTLTDEKKVKALVDYIDKK